MRDEDSKKLTVIGKVDPVMLQEKVEWETHKKVELVSPIPKTDGKGKGGGGNGGDNGAREEEKKKQKQNKEKDSRENKGGEDKKTKEKEVTEEFYGSPSSKKPFNSLEKLEIAKMPEWKQWHVLGNGEFPALQDLSVTTRTEALAVTRASRIIKARETPRLCLRTWKVGSQYSCTGACSRACVACSSLPDLSVHRMVPGNEGGEKKKKGGEENEKGGGNLTVVLKPDCHCEGCVNKVVKAIRSVGVVEKVMSDVDSKKLTVIGKVDLKKSTKKNEGGEKKKKEGGEENKKDGGNLSLVLKSCQCEGCVSTVVKAIRSIGGVEKVMCDVDSKKLTVIGKVDPVMLREEVERKTQKNVEVVSPIPKKDSKGKGGGDNGSDNGAGEEKKKMQKQNKEKDSRENTGGEDKKTKEKEMKIEDYLYQKDLHEPLTGMKPESIKEEDWKLKDRQALRLIWLTLSRNVAFNIVKEKTTYDLLKALSNMYENPSAINKVYLMRRLFNLQMPENGSVADHINEFNMIVSQLCSVDINFEDENKSLILMSSLLESWDTVVDAISSSYIGDSLILSVDSPVESWILDSGASFHSSLSKELFQNFKSGNFGKVYLADNKPLTIKGKRDVCIKTPAGNQWTLEDVRYIPGLKKNLIFVGQLDSTGYAAEFGKGCLNVVSVTESASGSCLWNNRLGHMSAKGMKMLAAKGALKGLKSVDMGLCKSCVMGKQKRVSFMKTARETKQVRLEMVHTNVWGPSLVSSLGGSRFYVTFIDDFSRKRWKTEVENQTGLKIKCLRSDNGGEFDKSEFKQFCAAEGIRLMRTVFGKARQNGIAKG
ncbi:putative 50S ribosomal protein L18-like [Capsicum annuum]|nr:putative 50S ribosomal protein L18-like [Capsicum annuum]